MRYIALLRGINVGGKNNIKMTELTACFRQHGFESVRTYIQSGNVLFSSSETDHVKLTRTVEALLSETFHYTSRVVILSETELQTVVRQAPKDFGAAPDKYRYDIIFLKPPLTAAKTLPTVKLRPEVDDAVAGERVLYFSRLIARASQSYLSKIVGTPAYLNMTIRNWNTTSKLLQLLDSLD